MMDNCTHCGHRVDLFSLTAVVEYRVDRTHDHGGAVTTSTQQRTGRQWCSQLCANATLTEEAPRFRLRQQP